MIFVNEVTSVSPIDEATAMLALSIIYERRL